MSKFITVATFEYPQHAYVIKSKLESEGIVCFLQDELTVQSYNYISNAAGGVKLQIREADLNHAIPFLEQAGISYTDEAINPESIFIGWFKKTTNQIPVLKRIAVVPRLVILSILITLPFITVLIWSTIPTTQEILINNTWCVERVTYKNVDYTPSSIGIRLNLIGKCDEWMNFRENRKVVLPGFNTKSIWGMWEINRDSMVITKVDTLQQLYQNRFQIEQEGKTLVLRSTNTVINARRL